jgi:hypothetical protein
MSLMGEKNSKSIKKNIFPNILKALLWGSITFILVYNLPLMILSADLIPNEFGNTLLDFALISVFFVVIGQLFSGTIIGCGIGIARALVIITYFFTVANGGVFSIELPVQEVVANLTVDLSIILLMITSVNMFDIVKNILEAISILNNKQQIESIE